MNQLIPRTITCSLLVITCLVLSEAYVSISTPGTSLDNIENRGRDILALEDGNRKTWDGTEISNRFCALDSSDTCHWGSYANYLSKNGLPGGILAIMSLLAFIIFISGRYCCNTFGGRHPSYGILRTDDNSFNGYYSRHVTILKIALAITFVLIAVFTIIGFVGNADINSGINTTSDTITSTADTIAIDAQKLQTLLASSSYADETAAFVSSSQAFKDKADSATSEIKKYNKIRSPVLIISFVLPLILLVLAAAAIVFKVKHLAMLAGLLCFFCSFIIWASFGVHIMANVVTGDLCTEIQYASSGNESVSSGDVNALASCLSNSSSFSSLSTAATDALASSLTSACSAMNEFCGQSGVTCAVTYSGDSCTASNIDSASTTTTVSDDGATRTLASCATSCTSSSLQSSSASVVSSLNTFTEYESFVENEILPILNCTFVKETYANLDASVCTVLRRGVVLIIVAACLIGVLFIPASILLIMGFKRFRKQSYNGTFRNTNQNKPLGGSSPIAA